MGCPTLISWVCMQRDSVPRLKFLEELKKPIRYKAENGVRTACIYLVRALQDNLNWIGTGRSEHLPGEA